ncbi:MAG: phosphodiester glycosidase family protein, partial [Ignavibacteriaceae bacterium]|nr:phosphodiester glycosidase family protein [Ignavibacteriaceae bacterium]
YYVTRGFFGFTETREFSVDWIYHFGNNVIDIYKYNAPSPNGQGSPAPAPTVANGLRHYELLAGLGGGPVLVKNGQRRITYDQEVFWGSGVGIDNRDPRTAVGFTSDKKVIMLVADGRQTISDGLSLYELADVMIELGCVEAMNLDGGGSSQMAASGQLVNRPLGGTTQRTIPTMLAVVSADSINLLPPVYDVKKIDTGDSSYVKFNGTWTTSNLAGYWANTPAMIAAKGTGASSVTFTPNLYKAGEYDVYAWWVAASNRAKDAPFIIKHKNGIDTVRADQTLNGSKWVRLGAWEFTGDSTDQVILGDFCTLGDYVVADAIRFLSFDSTLVSAEEELPSAPVTFALQQNFPNPFNPSTVIQYSISEGAFVDLKIYDVLGREVATLVSEYKQPGFYHTVFDMAQYSLSSGTYFYRLSTGKVAETRKMLYLK